MAGKNTKVIERLLTPAAQVAALKLVKRLGVMKTVLSAGVIALSKLPAEERDKIVDETIGLADEKTNKPENLQQAIKTVIRIVSGSGKDIQILPDEYDKLTEYVNELFGPQKSHESIRSHKRV
jgi:ABC-type phosphate/phosphonate transport system substrate-binding protein